VHQELNNLILSFQPLNIYKPEIALSQISRFWQIEFQAFGKAFSFTLQMHFALTTLHLPLIMGAK